MLTVPLDAATIHYDATGPESGRPVLFVHGFAMAASLWRPLTGRLADRGLRCLAPTWPLGGHSEAMHPGADATLPGIAATVDAFMAALDLEDVVLVGNDTGGVVAQLVAVHHPERLGGLVLTSCDAFEHFPPAVLKPFIAAAKSKIGFRAVLQPLRSAAVRRRAFGPLAHHSLDDLTAEWATPALHDAGVAEDLRRLSGSLRRQTTLDVAARLGEFSKPARIIWSADDEFFPVGDGRRLAAALPNADLTVIEDARTFSMIDQPDRLADLISELAAAEALR